MPHSKQYISFTIYRSSSNALGNIFSPSETIDKSENAAPVVTTKVPTTQHTANIEGGNQRPRNMMSFQSCQNGSIQVRRHIQVF